MPALRTPGLLLMILLVMAAPLKADTTVDFKEILWYAERAKAAYESETFIRARYGDKVLVANVLDSEVQFFVENFPEQKRQLISIRGTDNLANILQDGEYLPTFSETLGIYVHRGFHEDTLKLLKQLRPHLKPEYQLKLTGHSLGAAISTLLMMYLQQEGFSIEQSINFGQPKITTAAGAQKFATLPLVRIVDREDVVPELPATTLLDSLHGTYTHFGPEVILLNQKYYIELQRHQSMHASKGSFWKNLGHESLSDHYMDNYLRNIRSKLDGAERVGFDQRN